MRLDHSGGTPMVESWWLYKEPETNADVSYYMTPSVTLGLSPARGHLSGVHLQACRLNKSLFFIKLSSFENFVL